MKIVSAIYGASRGQRDVTTEVRALVGASGRALFYVSNGLFGDPCPYQRKQLSLTYEHEGATQHLLVDENALLVAPPSHNTSLGIWYTNNGADDWVLRNSLGQLSKARGVDILTCVWSAIPGNPFSEKHFHYPGRGGHVSICLQILTLLSLARAVKRYDRVFFLEHDVLYPEDYFDMSDVPTPLAVNDRYIGLVAQGYQTEKDDHEPLHQMVMDHDFALKHFHTLLDSYLRGDGMNLEPEARQTPRVRRHTKTPAIHVNHGKHLTSHFATYRPASLQEIPYWGPHARWWGQDAFPH
jgi:hypothetical protein